MILDKSNKPWFENVVDRRTVALHPLKPVQSIFWSLIILQKYFPLLYLNFHHTKWLETWSTVSGSNGSFESMQTKFQRSKLKAHQCLINFLHCFGLAYVILLSIPIIKILFGSKDYITKYYSVEALRKLGIAKVLPGFWSLEGRKDRVTRNQRASSGSEHSIIKGAWSQTSTAAQICQRRNIFFQPLYHGRRQYAWDKFGNEMKNRYPLCHRFSCQILTFQR